MFIQISELVPLALAIAISPLPVTGLLLVLASPGGARSGAGFGIGWLLGIALATAIATLGAAFLPPTTDHYADGPYAIVPILIGAALAVIGIVRIRRHHASEAPPKVPRWLAAVDRLNAPKAAVFGFLLAIGPKKFILAAAAGLLIGRAHHDVGWTIFLIALFSVLGSVSIIVPFVLFVTGGERTKDILDRAREFTLKHLGTITNVAFMVLGLVLIVVGIVRF